MAGMMKAAGGWPILVLRRDQESMPRHIDICKTFERIFQLTLGYIFNLFIICLTFNGTKRVDSLNSLLKTTTMISFRETVQQIN